MRLTELDARADAVFPPVHEALHEPDGLLAWGGDLSPRRLLGAYRHGCFPWFSDGQPILWWSPDPRLILRSDGFHVSRSLRRFLRRCDWTLRADSRFDTVIRHCANTTRKGQGGTWILPTMIAAYRRMHALGHAHSVEAFDTRGRLAGGIYGIAIGRMFFGESMFSHADNGSKVALLALCRFMQARHMPMLDCQMQTDHLLSLGAQTVSRDAFVDASRELCAHPVQAGSWSTAFGTRNAIDLLAP